MCKQYYKVMYKGVSDNSNRIGALGIRGSATSCVNLVGNGQFKKQTRHTKSKPKVFFKFGKEKKLRKSAKKKGIE